MKNLLFAFKRTLKSVSFLMLLTAYAAVIYLASMDAAMGSYPPAGVCGGGEGEAVQRIISHLTENGFVWFDEEDEMLRRIENGELDCGVILPEDLALRLERGTVDSCAHFLTSPLSITPELYRSHVSAAIFREYAPYIAADALAENGVAREELLAEYERMFAQGYVFSFEILSVDGEWSAQTDTDDLVMGAAALLMFAILLGVGTENVRGNLVRRIGARKMLLTVILPGTVAYLAATVAAGSAGLLLAGEPELTVPLCIYAVLLGAVRIFMMAILDEMRERYILLALVLILSPALCPIFVDLSLFSPVVRVLRCLLPPYWLWLAAQKPTLWLVIGCASMIAAYGALCARWHWGERLIVWKIKEENQNEKSSLGKMC